jgi:hypothetical protein
MSPSRQTRARWTSFSVAGFERFAFDAGSDKRTWLGSRKYPEE